MMLTGENGYSNLLCHSSLSCRL